MKGTYTPEYMGRPMKPVPADIVGDLAAVGLGERPVFCGLGQARPAARRFFADVSAAKRVAYFVVDPSNDTLRLVTFGRRLGHKVEWNFGPCGRNIKFL